MNPLEKDNYFQDFLDKASNLATARGAKNVSWNDIWVALLTIPKTANVLAERGINARGLSTEISFIEKFKSGAIELTPSSQKEEVEKIIEQLKLELRDYLTIAMTKSVDQRVEAAEDLIQYLNSRLRTQKIYSDGDDAMKHIALKAQVIQTILGDAMENVEFEGFKMLQGSDAVMLKTMIAQGILGELLSKPLRIGGGDEDLLGLIKSLQVNPMEKPSPVELVDFIIRQSGALYENLLFRNGLRTTDAERKDELADQMPDIIVQNVALGALSEAYELNSKRVLNRHIALTLLQNHEVRVHLSRVGIKDLVAFEDSFRELTKDLDEKPEGQVSIHAEITDEFKATLDQLGKAYKAKERTPDMLFWLAKNDPALDKALNKAGLRRKMLKEWQSKYDAKEEKEREEDKKKEKKKEGFEVSDYELDELLKTYCADYVQRASKKKFDPMIGNEGVMDKVITTLMKRGKKNPVMVGGAGIGKSKIFEGLAQRIVKGDVPPEFIGSRLYTIDLQAMNSPWRGEFEGRVIKIFKGVAERNAAGKMPPIMLGIDELAVAQNTGTHSGDPNGFRGLIKPYITAGDIFLISTTTLDEYQTQVEKDPALARRMPPIHMDAPNDEQAGQILLGIKRKYSTYHKLRIPDALVKEIAIFAGRYIHTINQPDKSIDLLDEACAYARKESAKTLTLEHVIKALSAKTNTPEEFFRQSDTERYANVADFLGKRVLGQPEAIRQISQALQISKAGFKDDNVPAGMYLLVGPTGVGKTELTIAIAEFLRGEVQKSLKRFDMSEFTDASSVSKFIGTSMGIQGSDQGGGLVKAVRNNPYLVFLYDEIEKAHPDVFNVLLAPFSNGIITDGRGIEGDMRQTLNFMTSNLGATKVMEEGKRLKLDPVRDYEAWQKMARPIYEEAVKEFFKPEFLNRLDGVIYFDSLPPEVIRSLVERRHEKTAEQLKEKYGLDLQLSPQFLEAAAIKGYDVSMGARPLRRAWRDMVEAPMAAYMLSDAAKGVKKFNTLVVDADIDYDFGQAALSSDDDVARRMVERRREIAIQKAAEIKPVFKLIRKVG